MCIIRPFVMWEGRDFPKASEILYAEGRLLAGKIPSASRSGSRVGTVEICESTKECYFYYCGYSAYHIPALQSCFDNYQNLKSHHRKQVKVGYYYQKDFLWFHNPNRQMVSLEIEGEIIKSYKGTQIYIKRYHEIEIILNALIFIVTMIAYYFGFVFKPKIQQK